MLRKCLQQSWLYCGQFYARALHQDVAQQPHFAPSRFASSVARVSSSSSCGSPAWADGAKGLGVVKEISDLSDDLSGIMGSMRTKFQVVEFLPDGTVAEGVKDADGLSLNLRDISLFTRDSRFTKQRATIAARDNAILFRTEVCRAIVFPHKAILFPLRRRQDTIRLSEALLRRINHSTMLPFELQILDGLLDATACYFERKGRRIQFLMERMIEEIDAQGQAHVSNFQRLIPMRRAMTEMQYDVKETRQAIAEVADNNNLLAAICLTENQETAGGPLRSKEVNSKHVRLARALLDSYERQVHTVEGALKEMEENLDDAREVWHMEMDCVRNRIIRINLIMSISSFSLLLSSVPAGFFGMNLTTGYENIVGIFPFVTFGCLGLTVTSCIFLYSYYRFWPSRRHLQRVGDRKALRDILFHRIDDFNDLLAAITSQSKALNRKQFEKIVRSCLKDPPITDGEIDLLYRAFDANRDGFLEAGEMLNSQDRIL